MNEDGAEDTRELNIVVVVMDVKEPLFAKLIIL